MARYLEREYSPGRLLYPQRRMGAKGEGRFARISWNDALDEISERLKTIAAEFGPESILPYSYGGSMGYLQSADHAEIYDVVQVMDALQPATTGAFGSPIERGLIGGR